MGSQHHDQPSETLSLRGIDGIVVLYRYVSTGFVETPSFPDLRSCGLVKRRSGTEATPLIIATPAATPNRH